MQELLDRFTAYLVDSEKKTHNTVLAYRRDIAIFLKYLSSEGIRLIEADKMTIISYLLYLKKIGKSSASVSRNLASLRAFYSYLNVCEVKIKDPTQSIEAPKTIKKEPHFLTVKEMEILVNTPKDTDAKGIRDRAMLELLYATGIKVSELVDINSDDINLNSGLLRCRTKTHERFVPIGKEASAALEKYINEARPKMIFNDKINSLFVNRNGTKLSRQGFWKILKEYGRSAGIKKDITPYSIRHSFAIHLLENGADLEAIRQLLGHNDISATQVYTKMIDGHIKEVYKKSHPRA